MTKESNNEPSKKSADDYIQILQGTSPANQVGEDIEDLLLGVREHALWESAEQASKTSALNEVDEAWSKMQTRLKQEGLVDGAPPSKNSENTQSESHVIQGSFTKKLNSWLPIAASLAAISVSLYVFFTPNQYVEEGYFASKGTPSDSQGVSTLSPMVFPLSLTETTKILEDLSSEFEIRDIKELSTLIRADEAKNLYFTLLLSPRHLTEEQKNMLDKYHILVSSQDTYTSIDIIIQVDLSSE